jgi:GNAT superfamily N-acetyltransferase
VLDRSIPYFNILMVRRAGTPLPPRLPLPAGFAFRPFHDGDEVDWAEIEASVGEFAEPASALARFRREYLPAGEDALRRVFFIRYADGAAAATATAWWNTLGGRRVPSLHWVAVRPSLQGGGLGRALIFEAVRRMHGLEGDVDFCLHTQTWSYRAVGLYLRAGFRFLTEGTLDGYANDYAQALPLLREKMGENLRPEWLQPSSVTAPLRHKEGIEIDPNRRLR